MQESPGLKPDWCWGITLFSIKNPIILLNIDCSKILIHIGDKDIGRYLFKRCLPFFLWTGTILPFFQSNGDIPFARQSLNMSSKGLHSEFLHIFNISIFSMLRFWIIFNMSVFANSTNDKRFSVRKWSRRGALLSIFDYGTLLCKKKEKKLRSLAFFLKSVTNFLLWNNDGITGVLRLFRKNFNILQYTLVLFWIIFNIYVNLKKYFCFE